MSKKQNYTIDALMGKVPQENELSLNKNLELIQKEKEKEEEEEEEKTAETQVKPESPIVGQDLISSLAKMKGLKRDGSRTKTDISRDLNNKIMFYSKLLEVNGYAIVETAVQEWFERNERDLKKLQRQVLK